MNMLAIETSSSKGSIALQVGNLLRQVVLAQQRQQLTEILPTIDSLLSQQHLQVRQLDALVFSAGAGSFTGIRIALGIAQGLALAADIPVAVVPSLQALAQTAWRLHRYQHVFCCINAYMQQIYAATYKLHGDQLMHPVVTGQLLSPKAVRQWRLPNYHGVGDAWQAYGNSLQSNVIDKTLLFPEAQDLLTLLPIIKMAAIDDVVVHYLRGKSAWQRPD